MNEGPLFNEENIAALLHHLPDGSLAHQLVTSASNRATRSEANAALAKIVQDRVDTIQKKLDAVD